MVSGRRACRCGQACDRAPEQASVQAAVRQERPHGRARMRPCDRRDTSTVSENERRQRDLAARPGWRPTRSRAAHFPTAFRGISETDVRSFLKRVSEELATGARAGAGARRADRGARGAAANATAARRGPSCSRSSARRPRGCCGRRARPRPTFARRPRSAPHALVHDANEVARRMRQDADDVLGVKTAEAEGVAQGLLEEAEQRAIRSAAGRRRARDRRCATPRNASREELRGAGRA